EGRADAWLRPGDRRPTGPVRKLGGGDARHFGQEWQARVEAERPRGQEVPALEALDPQPRVDPADSRPCPPSSGPATSTPIHACTPLVVRYEKVRRATGP